MDDPREAMIPFFRRLLGFQGSRIRPEPDEALRRLWERCKTGRASLTSTCNDLQLFLEERDTNRQSYARSGLLFDRFDHAHGQFC